MITKTITQPDIRLRIRGRCKAYTVWIKPQMKTVYFWKAKRWFAPIGRQERPVYSDGGPYKDAPNIYKFRTSYLAEFWDQSPSFKISQRVVPATTPVIEDLRF